MAPDLCYHFRMNSTYTFGVFGDIHYWRAGLTEKFYKDIPASKRAAADRGNQKDDPTLANWMAEEPANFAAAAKALRTEHAAFAVQLGDLVSGGGGSLPMQKRQLEEGWKAVRKSFGKLPLIPVIGNHETYDFEAPGSYAYPGWREVMQPHVAEELGLPEPIPARHYSFRHGPDLFIAYNSNEDEYEFTKKTLEENPDARWVFTMGHIPVICPVEDGIEIDSPWAGNEMEKHNRFLELLQSRNAICLVADTHRLGLLDYVTHHGRITQLMALSIPGGGAVRDFATTPGEYPGNWNCACYPHMRMSARQATMKGGLVRYWLAGGSGYYVLRVADDSVVAEFVSFRTRRTERTFTLRGPGADCAPLSLDLPFEYRVGTNRIPFSVPESLRVRTDLTYRFGLPDGWTLGKVSAAEGFAEFVVPPVPATRRREACVRCAAVDPSGRIVGNECRHFLRQEVLSVPRADAVGLWKRRAFPTDVFGEPGKYRLSLAWDAKGLLLHFVARDPAFAELPPDGVETWWNGSALELFADPLDRKSFYVSKDTFQLVLVPVRGGATESIVLSQDGDGVAPWTPATGNPRRRYGVKGIEATRKFSRRTGEFEITARIAWSVIRPGSCARFAPKAGAVLGFEAAYRDVPLLGGETKKHDDPSTWARIRLA